MTSRREPPTSCGENVPALAAWSVLAAPDPDVFKTIRDLGPSAALKAAAAGRPGLERFQPQVRDVDGAAVLEQARQFRMQPLLPAQDGWPTGANDLGDAAPLLLWSSGQVPSGPRVAVVGSRAATAYGVDVAAAIGADLARGGVCVATTGGYGVAAAATQAALTAGGAVLVLSPAGAGRAFPSGHAELLAQVRDAGAVLAERGPGVSPSLAGATRAYALLAAICDAVVVVEAGRQSNVRAAVWSAHRLGRRVGAVPGPVTSVTSAGVHDMLREDLAEVVCTGEQVLEMVAGVKK